MKADGLIHDSLQQETTTGTVSEVHFLDLLTILARRRRFILAFTIGAAVLTAVIVLLIPNKYTAETLLLPPAQNSPISTALMGQLTGSQSLATLAGASLGIRNPGTTYVALFRSRTVEDSMVERFGLLARYHKKNLTDGRAAFEHESTVVLDARSGLIQVTVTNRDPKLAAEMANAYVDELHKHTDNLAITEASQRRIFFQQQLLEANQNLTTAEDAMKKTEQSTGILQVDSQARSLIESAAILRGQITAQEVQLQSMRTYATEDNPQMILAEQQLDALKAQLAKLAGPNADATSDVSLARSNIPETGMEYLNRLRDVRYYETIDDLIAKQFEMAKLDEAREGAIVQVADVAVPPDKKSSPKRTIIVLIAATLTFLLTSGWTILAHGIERGKQDPDTRERLEALRASFRRENARFS